MPTHEESSAFLRDFKRLTREQRTLFLAAVGVFVEDLLAMEEGLLLRFRPSLRVRRVMGLPNVYEMSWNSDGRALFLWGEERKIGKRHVQWLRCGSHDILP